ncbi:hypothetical protein [Nitratifractor salsuginis]|uniref:Uncharacterized protein n=1 Tax=Nitratifractor salsuginis (strain DSM 16511 / JCM 12458 / E9I37-1) TaxID=749222 RepID=E6X1R4_NITSE|nr:hypothetical protein [Nitratifractor salsuginis]ADV47055.1 hypothetical protein Nitsa_1810 [Nitratifractor salsuginis DSM 16511]
MAIQNLEATITGIAPLLLNNPQAVDPFNRYSRAMKQITAKRKKTDDDLLELRKLEIETKLYWDDDLGVYVPSTWILAALAKTSFKKAKIAKAEIRAGVFAVEPKLKLNYDGMDKVKKIEDVVGNSRFHTQLILPQGQVRVSKAAPIFHKWSFDFSLEFDDEIIDRRTLIGLLEYSAKYGGFGDFRPSYGRAKMEAHDE